MTGLYRNVFGATPLTKPERNANRDEAINPGLLRFALHTLSLSSRCLGRPKIGRLITRATCKVKCPTRPLL